MTQHRWTYDPGRAVHAAAWLMAHVGKAPNTGAAFDLLREHDLYHEAGALRVLAKILKEIEQGNDTP